jgi:hypothetical protein
MQNVSSFGIVSTSCLALTKPVLSDSIRGLLHVLCTGRRIPTWGHHLVQALCGESFSDEAHLLKWSFESENRLCIGIFLGSEQDSTTGFVYRIERFYRYLTPEFLVPSMAITAFRQEMRKLFQPTSVAWRVSIIGAVSTWILGSTI